MANNPEMFILFPSLYICETLHTHTIAKFRRSVHDNVARTTIVVRELVRGVFLIKVDLRTNTPVMRESFTQSAITQFYVPPVPATSEQIQPSGDNYRLKRLNPAGYRFRRPIIEPEGGIR